MRIQPRQQLLDIWRATARSSYQNRSWVWGGRESANSVSDAEQLLCVILPATAIENFRVDDPDQTDEDVLRALHVMGNAADIPRHLVGILLEYFDRYSDNGVPLFHGGSSFSTLDPDDKPTTEQLELDVVESYAISITLTLATLSFARKFETIVTRKDLRADTDRLKDMASTRLTAAMVGLLRSFTVNAFDADSDFGRHLLRTVNQVGLPEKRVTTQLIRELRDVTAGLQNRINIGSGQVNDVDLRTLLYECGWSWGVVRDAPTIDFVTGPGIVQRDGYALDAPYLYFTVVALDGLAELFSSRTRRDGLLDDLQQRLAAALNVRWDLTQSYWSTLASFGDGRWPLEDLPWRATDGVESDYFSLLVTSIAARDLAERRGTDVALGRLGRVLGELANRARITRRPIADDPGVRLHSPGVAIALDRSEEFGPPLAWEATDFAGLLLKRSLRVTELINDIDLRRELLELVDQVWDHVLARRHRDSTGKDLWHGLWDQPANVFMSVTERFTQPAWHHTVRVVESLLFAAGLANSSPLHAGDVSEFATNLLAEAEHLFDQEQLAGSTEAGSPLRGEMQIVGSSISRAREILPVRPGSATSLLLEALRKLEQLAAARQEVIGAS